MNCTDIEVLLSDYIDETLSPNDKAALELHLDECPSCAEMARDAATAVAFISRAEEVTPPPDLITRIAHQIPSAKQHSPAVSGLKRWFSRYLQPILQPRFAMGMAMTILSFSMLGRFAGIEPRQLRPADLNPVKVWHTLDDRMYRSWQRAVKYYESVRLVYEIKARLHEWTEQEEEDRTTKAAPADGAQQLQKTPAGTPSSDNGRTDTNGRTDAHGRTDNSRTNEK